METSYSSCRTLGDLKRGRMTWPPIEDQEFSVSILVGVSPRGAMLYVSLLHNFTF